MPKPFKHTNETTEFEIQAMLYTRLLQEGFKVKGEVTNDHSRFDLVVYKDDISHIIIEVKNWNNPVTYFTFRYLNLDRKTKQLQKYLDYNLPVITLGHYEQIEPTVQLVKKLIDKDKHKKLYVPTK